MEGIGKRLHLVGIGGVGMAGLAVLLKNRGHVVDGCDLHATVRTSWLGSQGIPVKTGHDVAHLEGADELVVTPAVPADAPERISFKGTVRSRGEVLAALVSAHPDSIAVCGSHGKTTTATWIARLLIKLGERVEWAIGGETGDFPVAGLCGPEDRPPVLVVEADESDGTLADYSASTLVITRVEYDHPDHFKTPADYFACYDAARSKARSVVEGEKLQPMPELWQLFPTLAEHNLFNANLAVKVAEMRGHAIADILAALADVVTDLPDRRFQVVWKDRGKIAVVTDYAHHPTEMECAVAMARKACSGRLRVLFQPHRYSRTKALLNDFARAFELADEVILCPTYAAFEKPIEGGDIADLYLALRIAFGDSTESPRLYLARSCAEAWDHARNLYAEGDLTLLLGAGDIIDLVPRICDECAHPEKVAPAPVRLIGAGSNTWKSDLADVERFAAVPGTAGKPGATLVRDHPTLCPWMAGIPGTIGGWVRMNAGAFGHSISEILEAVQIDGRWVPSEQCGFSYRHSDIRGEIQDIRLRPDPATCDATPADYLARRRRFPARTWGSFFKNPPGDFAGRLLESVGAKDMRVGGAHVWSEHANVIVAGEGSTPSDVLALARLLRNRVFFRLGVSLEPEVVGISVE